MNLHILQNYSSPYIKKYVDFLEDNFSLHEHVCVCVEKEKPIDHRVIHVGNALGVLFILVPLLFKAKKIFLHGLWDKYVILTLFLFPVFLKKSYWLIWGGDLYSLFKKKRRLRSIFLDWAKKQVIKRLKGVVTHLKGDYELVRDHFGFCGQYLYTILYIRNVTVPEKSDGNIDKDFVQIGNSPDPTNNHEHLFELIAKTVPLNQEKYKKFVPLAYGNYAERIIKLKTQANHLFGAEHCYILEDLRHLPDYIKLLSRVDVALFDHDRQQAVGNIILLLSLGATIYLRSDITTWSFLHEHGLIVRDIATLKASKPLLRLQPQEVSQNRENIEKYFTEERAVMLWRKIFNG